MMLQIKSVQAWHHIGEHNPHSMSYCRYRKNTVTAVLSHTACGILGCACVRVYPCVCPVCDTTWNLNQLTLFNCEFSRSFRLWPLCNCLPGSLASIILSSIWVGHVKTFAFERPFTLNTTGVFLNNQDSLVRSAGSLAVCPSGPDIQTPEGTLWFAH